MLNIPMNAYPVYHASKLKPHIANDASLFPGCELAQPGPILTADGLEEHLIDEIVASRCRGRRWQFLMHWVGYGPDHDEWLPAADVKECESLD